jgi:hypothetical protein
MRILIIITFIILAGFGTVFAQNDTAKIILKKPMLNGHTFSSVNTTKSAFIHTQVAAELGIGNTGIIELPGIKIGETEILAFAGNVAFLSANVSYQQKLNDWLALSLTLNIGGRLGTSISTILVDGVNTYSGGSLGWNFRVIHKKKFNLSGSLFVKNISGRFINLIGYITDIIDSIPNPAVIKNIPVLNVGIGAQGAWAFNNTFGLQFGAEFSYGESFQREINKLFSTINITGDVDLMPRKHIPLGFALGYMLTSSPEKTYLKFIYTNIFSGKIAYTGSSDFELGLQFILNKVELASEVKKKPMLFKTQLDFKFYF